MSMSIQTENVRVSQPQLVAALLRELDRQGVKTLIQRVLNACIRAATEVKRECDEPYRPSTAGMGLAAWLASDDTGLSSRFLAFITAGGPRCENHHPHDGDDFGRCVRFLEAVEPARAALGRMAEQGPVWAGLVTAWEELEALYRAEQWKPLYERIQAIEEQAT